MLPRLSANCYSGFRPPSKVGAASMTPRSPAGEALPFVPRVLSPRGSSLSFLGVLSPKRSWGGVDDAALARRCRTAVARRWAIRLIAANNTVRPVKADAAPGLNTLLPARRRRADVSELYWRALKVVERSSLIVRLVYVLVGACLAAAVCLSSAVLYTRVTCHAVTTVSRGST